MGRVDVRGIRRKQILDATKRLVVEKGWTEVSILDICHEAGISSGVITYHFRNKDEIMFALLEEFLDQIEAHSYRAVAGAYTLEEDISTFITILTSLQEAEPNFPSLLIQLVAASLHRPEIAKRLHGLFQTARQQKIEEWKTFGVVSSQGDDGVVLVSMLHSVILGVMLGGPFMGIDLPRERLMQETKRILLACFPPSNPSSQETAHQ
jgi:AcrR family transcriptional regulator